jgi:hypothetical protein
MNFTLHMSATDTIKYAKGNDVVLEPYLQAAAGAANRADRSIEIWTADHGTLVATVDPKVVPPKTYLVTTRIGLPSISDGERVWAYGPLFNYDHVHDASQRHRAYYCGNDAQAVCDWLNQRERGYKLEGV